MYSDREISKNKFEKEKKSCRTHICHFFHPKQFFSDFLMSVAATQSAFKALYELYWKSKPDMKNYVMDKIASIGNINVILEYLSNEWKNDGDLSQVNNRLDFLALYTIRIKDQVEGDIAIFIFSLYIVIARKNPLPLSHENYSKFLTILIPAMKSKGEALISRQLTQLDRQTSLFPTAHYVLFFPSKMNEFIKSMLEGVKNNRSIPQQNEWNETMCVLLRAKAVKEMDKLPFFTAIDYALSTNSNIESRINLLFQSFRFFNKLEISQLMRMHFDSVLKKITQKITLSALIKAMTISNVYYDIADNKEELLDLVFLYLLPFFKDCDSQNKQILDQVEALLKKLDQSQINQLITKHKDNTNITYALLYCASHYPAPETFTFLTSNVNPAYKEKQYECLLYLIKSGKFDSNFTIFLFSSLTVSDYDLIFESINKCKEIYLMNAIRYLQRNTDKEKLLKILETIASMETLPILNMNEITDATCTLISSYFVNKISDPNFSGFIKYLEQCHLNKEGEYKFECDEDQIFPLYINKFFSSRDDWKNEIFQTSLERIRRGDKNVVVTLICLAPDSVSFQLGVQFIKSDPTLLSAFLTAAITNIETDTLQFMLEMPKKKATGFISGLLGSTVMDKEILKVINNAIATIASFIKPSEDLFNVLNMLYQENLLYSDFSILAQSTSQIIQRLEENKDLTYFMERLCDNASRLDGAVFEKCIIPLLIKNTTISKSTARRVSSVWISYLASSANYIILPDSDFEVHFLREDYYKQNSKIILADIHERFVAKSRDLNLTNVFLSFKRIVERIPQIKKDDIKKELPALITHSMSNVNIVHEFCIKTIQDVVNVSMSVPPTVTDNQIIDNASQIEGDAPSHQENEVVKKAPQETAETFSNTEQFYSELAQRLSSRIKDEMKITEEIFELFKNQGPTIAQAFFFVSVCTQSPKEILTRNPKLVISFLETSQQLVEVNPYVTTIIFKTVTVLYSSNPQLLFTALLDSDTFNPTQQIYRTIIRGPQFKTILYQIIDGLAKNSKQKLPYIHRITLYFKMSVEENLLLCDAQTVKALIVLITATYKLMGDAIIDVVNQQKQCLRELTFSLFTATLPNSIPFELRDGESAYVTTIGAIVKMINQLKEEEIKKLIVSMEQLNKTDMYYAYIVFIAFMYSITPSCFDSSYKLTILKTLANCVADKRLTKGMKICLVRATAKKLNNQLVEQLEKKEIENIFRLLTFGFASIEQRRINNRSEGYFRVLLLIDDLIFNADLTQINSNIRRIYHQDQSILFTQIFIDTIKRSVTIINNPGTLPACFPEVFSDILTHLYISREKSVGFLKQIYGENFDYEQISAEAITIIGAKYSPIIRNVITTASNLQSLSVEDLTILGKLIKPVSTISDKKDIIEAYTKLLIRVATTQQETEITNLAISLIAELANASE